MSTPPKPDDPEQRGSADGASTPGSGSSSGSASGSGRTGLDAETTTVSAASGPSEKAGSGAADDAPSAATTGTPPPWQRGAAAGPGGPPSGALPAQGRGARPGPGGPGAGGPGGPGAGGPGGPGAGGPGAGGPGGPGAAGPGGPGRGGSGGPGGRGPDSTPVPVPGRGGAGAGAASGGSPTGGTGTPAQGTPSPGTPAQGASTTGNQGTGATGTPAQGTPAQGARAESGDGADGNRRAATALIDAPTNQLSPEQLGMRNRPRSRSENTGDDDEELADLASPRPSRNKVPRRASLQVKRFDPWSVLKLALVLGVALFFVWMFAVGVLYAVLDGMGVWAQLNGTYQDLTSDAGGGGQLITAGGVFGIAAIIGVINTILFTALASVSAFIYNISADVAGGIEVTLSERD